MTVNISPRAEAELEAIFAYGSKRWGWEQAEAYGDALIDAFNRIAARAIPWRAIPAELGFDGYRYRCGRHILYWRATENAVTILAVLRDSMDQGPRLLDHRD